MRCNRRTPGTRLIRNLALPTLVALATGGCATLSDDRPVTVASADEAASLEITQSSVEPWGTAAPALVPNFTMSGDAALAKVAPITERINRQMLDSFVASLAAGLPQSSSTSVLTTKGIKTDPSAATDGTTTELTDTTTKGPGTVPTVSTTTAGGVTLPGGGDVSGALGLDPYVQYRGAYYLNQMVQLMNREVMNAPSRRCYAPYLVKLKVAVMPYRARLPYAIHARIGFFDNDPDQAASAIDKKEAAAGDGQTGASSAATVPAVGGALDVAGKPPANNCDKRQVPMVMPIIAADDMQVALKSKTLEVAQQLGFALNFMVGGVGGNAGASNLKQSLSAILSNDLSSALTVTRSTENTLYMRIAPNNEPSGEPAMIGQTYDIAVLVLVPVSYLTKQDDPKVRFDLVTEFRDARTGQILSSPGTTRRVQILDRVLTPFLSPEVLKKWTGLKPETRLYAGDKLTAATTALDLKSMIAAMKCLPGTDAPKETDVANAVDRSAIERGCTISIEPKRARFLMTAMGEYIADSPFKGGMLDIPAPVDIGLPKQTVLVSDNGTSAASAIIAGVQGAGSARLQGYLELKVAGTGEVRHVPITGSLLDPVARTLTLTFPSPTTYKTESEKWEASGNSLMISFACDAEREWCPKLLVDANKDFATSEDVQLITKPSDVVGVSKISLSASANRINYDGSGGTIQLTIGSLNAKEAATLAISGGDILSATDSVTGPLALTGDGVVVPKNGRLTLTLGNLTGEDVTFTATAKVGSKATGSAIKSLPLYLKGKPAGEKP